MSNEKTAYISLGSNVGNRYLNLQRAVFELGRRIGNVLKTSSIYENEAVGFDGAPFYNACISVNTKFSAKQVLAQLLQLEKELGRERKLNEGYTDRPIDLDLIYYEEAIIVEDDLEVPHPRMQDRSFVLKPLADVAPQFYHPILKKDTRNLFMELRDKPPLEKKHLRLFRDRAHLFSQVQFISIEGNIGAGKTTLTHMIADEFNAKLVLERFADNPFLPKFYKDQSRYAFALEMSFLADRYQQFMDDTSQFDLFKQFMVSDYDIFKSLIFAKVTLQKDEFELYRRVFNVMYKEVRKPDVYVYLYQNTERLLQQIKKRGRAYEQDIKPDYLETINKSYMDFLKSYPEQNALIIDMQDLDFVANRHDYEYILDAIEAKLLEKQLTII
ncbi:2-amino-4-hydroxy-6-hydroxymethyldihydropteridine diphosphokinase [Flavobacterium sp. ASW18X]|uniref:2-amino-4-hydroxy-6- hydroxymethyldihydropteridine diphosphokinase n=1 Tax=Flavobacterium sp. ASW18X TaxID=2572595 RepID=UPI0010AE55BD|nr:2-amino-4-hydroxy-6-hydroxymethyldihydropteridine diphosphokinase [Flavobacterium sp. ASW18X]TKD66678.1 2-amino-4-hydroxy-6-hydroxymethyldihydropteridine diphosphokinase [Flavobacterium sp. ASW18X]